MPSIEITVNFKMLCKLRNIKKKQTARKNLFYSLSLLLCSKFLWIGKDFEDVWGDEEVLHSEYIFDYHHTLEKNYPLHFLTFGTHKQAANPNKLGTN